MPNNVFVMESCNLFCGDIDPHSSNHLVLQELKLPGLEENFTDHTPTGAPIAIEVDTHITRLEATFNLAGWNYDVMTMIGESNRMKQRFTAYGLIRDRRTGEALESVAVMEGRLGRVNPTNFRKGDLQAHEFSIRAITHYELTMAELQIYFWDFFTSDKWIGNVDQNLELRSILRIAQY